MSERIRGGYDDALYKSTFTLLYFYFAVLFTLTKHVPNMMREGTATMTSRYRQPSVGITNIETATTNAAPIAHEICHIQSTIH